jgi:hypothetical protein
VTQTVAFPPERGTMRDYAEAYLAAGWSVFPLRPKSKLPLAELLPKDEAGERSWKPFQTKRPTMRLVDAWLEREPEMNLAVVTGRISGIAVLDLDGAQAVAALKERRITPPGTLTQRTPHGWHGVYRLTDLVVKNTAGMIAPHVDTRGEGGYIVAPPSRLEDGAYTWVARVPMAAAPEWMAKPERAARAAAPTGERGEQWVKQALAEGAPEGQRNDTAARLAGYFHSKGLPADIVETVLLDTFARHCTPAFDPNELREVIHKIDRYPLAARGDAGVMVL